MKVLIVTQAVDRDSPTLGFFVEWIREFAAQCERVDVIGLSVGAYALPPNVRVASMGKESGVGRFRRVSAYWRHLFRFSADCDGVFIHMCPEYLIAGWPLLFLRRMPVVFWYAHRARNARVRLAAFLATFIATSVPGAFTIRSSKVRTVGQGIPLGLFAPLPQPRVPPLVCVAAGRIAPVKRLELLIEAVSMLRKRGIEAVLEIWGAAALGSDRAYETKLRAQARALGLEGEIRFAGAVPFASMPERYGRIAIALNASPDGAIDKAALEAMACARPVVVTNANFSEVLGADADACMARAEPEDIADRMASIAAADRNALGLRLRRAVEARHGLPKLVRDVLGLMRADRPRSGTATSKEERPIQK